MISKEFAQRLGREREAFVASGGWTDEQIDIVRWLQAEEELTGISAYERNGETS